MQPIILSYQIPYSSVLIDWNNKKATKIKILETEISNDLCIYEYGIVESQRWPIFFETWSDR